MYLDTWNHTLPETMWSSVCTPCSQMKFNIQFPICVIKPTWMMSGAHDHWFQREISCELYHKATLPTTASDSDVNSRNEQECWFPSLHSAPLWYLFWWYRQASQERWFLSFVPPLHYAFFTAFHYSPLLWPGTHMFRCDFKDISCQRANGLQSLNLRNLERIHYQEHKKWSDSLKCVN